MKVNILSDKKMELLGFHFNKYNERWVLIKPLISSIDFYFTIESNNDFCIDIIDDDFGQPYDYQYYLSKNPNNNFALQVQKKVNKLMQIFLNEGLIYEYKIGDYI